MDEQWLYLILTVCLNKMKLNVAPFFSRRFAALPRQDTKIVFNFAPVVFDSSPSLAGVVFTEGAVHGPRIQIPCVDTGRVSSAEFYGKTTTLSSAFDRHKQF